MKVLKMSFAILAIGVIGFSCSKEPLPQDEKEEIEVRTDAKGGTTDYYYPDEIILLGTSATYWLRTFNVQYGRGCTIGGGICYTGGHGFGDNLSVHNGGIGNAAVNAIHELEANNELGTALIKLESPYNGLNTLEVILTRDGHQDGNVDVPTDIIVDSEFADLIGVSEVTLLQGTYTIDYSTHPTFGKVYIDCMVN